MAKLPQGSDKIDIAYQQALERIDSQPPGHVELAKKVLSWVVYAKRPLSPQELCCALTIEPGDSELDVSNEPDIDDMVSVCTGLVVMDEESSIVRLVHYTTQDFLERVSNDWIPEAKLHIATTRLTYLCFEDVRFTRPMWKSQREMLRICSMGLSRLPESRRPKFALRDFPLASYARLHWLEHTRQFEAALSGLVRALFDQYNNLFNALRRNDDSRYCIYQFLEGLETGIQCAPSYGLKQKLSDMLPGSREEFAAVVDRAPIVGHPPLVGAAVHGHESTLKLLLDSGADIEVRSTRGFKGNALFDAAARGAKAIVEMLLDYGAKAGTTCSDHTTALQAAVFHGHLDIAKLLLAAGACPNADPGHFGTALAISASQGNEEMTTILIEAGADPNQQDGEIGTPLHWAAMAARVRVVQLLPNAGADPNPRNEQSGNVLQWAELSGCKEVVELLRVAGADQQGLCEWRDRAMRWASHYGRSHVLQHLLDSCLDMEPERYKIALRVAADTTHSEAEALVRAHQDRLESNRHMPVLVQMSPTREGHHEKSPGA